MVMPNARSVYHAIKSHFNKPSWSSIIHRTNIIFNPNNNQADLVQYSININEAIAEIESQMGTIKGNKDVTLEPMEGQESRSKPIKGNKDMSLEPMKGQESCSEAGKGRKEKKDGGKD
ncbi:hypothetical protein O181_035672 [Austropuccinia psidii MF-1]|uniref:Uncharacterized protein n=1 Tax=Austropuccinia psidii MF-1 TaxID=1389203 RepID=A0A9Q3H973_9BASI|nr:hypothetical protein [Austropuccinia psidii MF-1]